MRTALHALLLVVALLLSPLPTYAAGFPSEINQASPLTSKTSQGPELDSTAPEQGLNAAAPVYLALHMERFVLTAGETVALSVSVVSETAVAEAGRLRAMRLPAGGGGLWRSLVYAPWAQQNGSGGRLTGVWVGTQPNWANVLSLDYSYDSFGNVKNLAENGVSQSLVYDGQNRLTSAFGRGYAYDAAGRLTSYEGTSLNYNASQPVHGVKNSGYGYDANGNLTARPTAGGVQMLTWDGENRLAGVSGGGLASESYLYDADGVRVKVVRNGASVYFPFPFYELDNGTIVKYYFFAGQRVAMKRNSVLMDSLRSPRAYLHNDHLGSPVLTTSASATASQVYYARACPERSRRGKVRSYSGSFPTRYQFTGQYIDGSGLVDSLRSPQAYMNARYGACPELVEGTRRMGQFISPDTLVPDPGLLVDYNRFGYARGNPLPIH